MDEVKKQGVSAFQIEKSARFYLRANECRSTFRFELVERLPRQRYLIFYSLFATLYFPIGGSVNTWVTLVGQDIGDTL